MGISIILLILHTRKLEWDKYKESAYRENSSICLQPT